MVWLLSCLPTPVSLLEMKNWNRIAGQLPLVSRSSNICGTVFGTEMISAAKTDHLENQSFPQVPAEFSKRQNGELTVAGFDVPYSSGKRIYSASTGQNFSTSSKNCLFLIYAVT
jgi:hypothetical protein